MIRDCPKGIWASVEMHIGGENGENVWVCECSDWKADDCKECPFNKPELVNEAFRPEVTRPSPTQKKAI